MQPLLPTNVQLFVLLLLCVLMFWQGTPVQAQIVGGKEGEPTEQLWQRHLLRVDSLPKAMSLTTIDSALPLRESEANHLREMPLYVPVNDDSLFTVDVQAEQSFRLVLHNNRRQAYFITATGLFNVAFFLLMDDSILYRLPMFYYQSCCVEDVRAVGFSDVNADGYTDILVCTEFYRGYGNIDVRYAPQYFSDVYFGSAKGFYTNKALPARLEGIASLKKIRAALKKIVPKGSARK